MDYLLLLVIFYTTLMLVSSQIPPGAPIIDGPPVIVLNSQIMLTCTSSGGLPTPTVKWFRDDTEITTGISIALFGTAVTTSLTFTASKDDHLEYVECQAYNGVLQHPLIRTKFMEVYFSPESPVWTGPTTLTPGQQGIWTCISANGYPAGVMSMRNHNKNTQFTTEFTSSTVLDQKSYDVTGTLTWSPVIVNNGDNICCDVTHTTTSTTPQTVCRQIRVALVEPIAINAPVTQYTPTLQTTVTLLCDVTQGIASQIIWLKDNVQLNIGTNSRLTGGTVATESLTITNLQQSDGGNYVCRGIDGVTGDIVNTDTISVNPVGTPPITSIPQSSYTQILGQQVILGCTVNSPNSPLQEVQWTFTNNQGQTTDPISVSNSNGKYSGSSINSPSLTINSVASTDQGVYSCKARNYVGTSTNNPTTSLTVTGTIPTVQVDQASYSVTIGSTVTLVCTATASPTVSNVYWERYVNGVLTQITSTTNTNKYNGSTPRTPSLTIFYADESDVATYTCVATNSVGTGISITTSLFVIGTTNVTITEFTSEGEMATGRNVTVTCKAYISPPKYSVSVIWKLNDSKINPTNSSRWIPEIIQSNNLERWHFRLTVINIATSDAGLLTCVVGDGYVNSEETLVLNVIGKPTVDISPRTATATLGDIVNINCTVVYSFSVTTSIIWYKNGNIFNGNRGEVISRADNAHVTLVIYGIQNSAQYACSGINNYGEGDRLTSHITVIDPDNVYQYCPSNIDRFGGDWGTSIENAIAINPCPGDRTGKASRFCNIHGEWEEPNYSTCISKDLLNLTLQSELLKNGVEIKDVNSILLDLNNLTDIRKDLTSGELETSTKILDNIAYFIKERTANLSVDQLEIFVSSCDNLLRETNIPSWEQLKQLNLKGVTRIAKAVTVYTKAYTNVNNSEFQRTVQKDQLVVQVGKILYEDVTFPIKTQQLPNWITESKNQVTLSKDNFGAQQPVGYSATYYRNISTLFHEYYISEGVVTAMNGSYDVNSVVIDFSIEPTPTRLKHPLVVKFEHLRVNYSNPVCAFWDFDAISTLHGAWSFEGSKLVTSSDAVTVCQYDHTTNFAILMSSGKAPSSHSLVLSKISAAGCGISIMFLIATVTIYALLWRHLTRDTRSFQKEMKRDNAILLVNLCVALIISYILFLVGITLTDNKEVCTAMAVLLHYIFLVDFALMLAEGVELMINVFFVLKIISSRTKWLIPACWVVPAVIVGISVGATKLDGYGNSQYCWLSIESKLIWTFAGPVLTVILINFIILILVMKKITSDMTYTSTEKKKKTTTEQVKAGIRRVCVILPLFGVTWVLGAFSINEETVVFQYLFAVFNSLQGFFIFLMYIVLNNQVREGIQKIRKQKAEKSSTYSQKDTTKESSVHSTGLDLTDIEKSKTHSTGPINSISNNRYSHQMNDEKDTVPIHSTTPTDVPGPIINDNTKESKRKSSLDKDDKKLKLSDHRRDVLFQRSHTLAPGKQNHDGGHINQRVQRRSQYNSRPENYVAYYYDRPVMSYGEVWWPYVGNYPYPYGYERQRRPDEYPHQRGNTFSWSADC